MILSRYKYDSYTISLVTHPWTLHYTTVIHHDSHEFLVYSEQ